MIRPVTLAIVLALLGCQTADVQRAQPTLAIPAAWRADVGPASPVEGVLHMNTAELLRKELLSTPGIVITDVPYQVSETKENV